MGNNFLAPVYKGRIEYISFDGNDFYIYLCDNFPELSKREKIETINYGTNPCSCYYCYPEYMKKLLNEKLDNGYAIIGMFEQNYIVTKKENLTL